MTSTFEDLVTSTDAAVELLQGLRVGDPHCVDELREFPAFRALLSGDPDAVSWEHAPSTSDAPAPLFEHLVDRTLRRKLRGLELARRDIFQTDDALSADTFEKLTALVEQVRDAGLLPVVRAALLFLDFAKGGSVAQRERWETEFGADLSIHNEAARTITERGEVFGRFRFFRQNPVLAALVPQLIAVHGLAGQWVRGETPLESFAPWVEWLRDHGAELGNHLSVSPHRARELAAGCLHLIDVCDTAAVREGLLDERLYAGLRAVRLRLSDAASDGVLRDTVGLEERLRRLRHEARTAGEPDDRLALTLNALGDAGRLWLGETLPRAQLWYFEPATHALSTESAVKLLVFALAHAEQSAEVDATDLFHVTFQPLLETMGNTNARSRYRVRLVDALLRETDFESLRRAELPGSVLATFHPRIGRSAAVAIELRTSEEADALVTLLSTYETRSSVAFHQILKLLCDAYDLRKDEFDRLANEADYLTTMNAARSDKERMLDFVRPGRIVEIGPGGGVVLDLLEERFAGSDVVGIDLSEVAVAALLQRRAVQNRGWRVVFGDAFELPEIVGAGTVNTVIFCSVLHEIYSYVERDGQKFQLDSVRAMLLAAYEALAPGGRIIIRDGIKPPDGVRLIEFLDPDGPDFLRRFVAEFDGRAISVEWLGPSTARLSTADAMEFLYCYTWGPASFPYEVRELYGIMGRAEYEATVLEWLSHGDIPAVVPTLPDDLRSYLQPGYIEGLRTKVCLRNDRGEVVALPDSNALLVFEKPVDGDTNEKSPP